jgi:hypothetical protein
MAPKKKPLLDAYIRTEFGDELAEGIQADPERVAEDITYVPGFSELRVARDKQLAEVGEGKRDIKDVVSLPINLRWVRRSDSKGNPQNRNQVITANMGYEMVNAETDKGQAWLTRLPDGSEILPGGMIVKGDTVLMKCTAKRAAQNQAANFKRMVELGSLEFDAPPENTATPNGVGLSAMGGSVTKVATDGPINIKDTGRYK